MSVFLNEGTLTEAVQVEAANDVTPGNDQATDDTDVVTSADLSITGSATTPVGAGGTITYTYTVTNYGPSVGAGVSFTQDLPGGVSFVSASSSVGLCGAGDPFTCLLGDIAPGDFVTITVTATAPAAPGTYTDDASVDSSTADPDLANNATSAPVEVTQISDLSLDVDDHTTAVTAGTSSTYDVSVANVGPSGVPAGVVVSLPIPAGTTASSADPECSIGPVSVTCTSAAPIASGDQVGWQLTLDIAPGYLPGALTLTGTITSSPHADPVGANDTSTDIDQVDSLADVWVDVDDGRTTVTAGDGATHTYRVATRQ